MCGAIDGGHSLVTPLDPPMFLSQTGKDYSVFVLCQLVDIGGQVRDGGHQTTAPNLPDIYNCPTTSHGPCFVVCITSTT